MRYGLLVLLLVTGVWTPAHAAHYASLRREEVYLREGPTFRHRVLWIYRRKDYPVEVLGAYQTWRHVRDADGASGWVSQNMLSDMRTVLVIGKARAVLRAGPLGDAALLAWVQPGVVARLGSCKPDICEIAVGGLTGWIDKKNIWGVDAGEIYP
jgi:SH3-like domain-containing protein